MLYKLYQWPASVYPGEADEIPDAKVDIDVALNSLKQFGPQRAEYGAKNLGKQKAYLWQINFKVNRKQIRILYAPYAEAIVVFRIHTKTSPQEQKHAYELAVKRKKHVDLLVKQHGVRAYEQLSCITIH